MKTKTFKAYAIIAKNSDGTSLKFPIPCLFLRTYNEIFFPTCIFRIKKQAIAAIKKYKERKRKNRSSVSQAKIVPVEIKILK